ncbi:SMP-30/gluconolactonase/LRE family protein [Bacteroidota bacterium]
MFTEGPAFNSEGILFFTDIPANRIYQYSKDGKISVFAEETDGANGLYFDNDGNLVTCAGEGRKVYLFDKKKNKQLLLEKYEGKKLNSPNDLWIDKQGGIYFTDPRYGSHEGMEQDGMHVYYFKPGSDKVVRIIDDMTRPNGIIGSSDNKTLYVIDEGADQFYSYSIESPGKLSNKKLLLNEGADGMSIDTKDNVYLTVEKGIAKYDALTGEFTRYPLPVKPTNVVWHKNKLWVTTQSGELWMLELKVPAMTNPELMQ